MNPVKEAESFITSYVSFRDDRIALALACWALGTHCFESFDCFPYVTITSNVKRSGKTRLAECLSFLSHSPLRSGSLTAATLFRSIRDKKPTIFFDEAESLSSESASDIRSVLNIGYRVGQTVQRVVNNEVEDFPTYCPKVFILIGDVYDTLRDRSIIVEMQRGEPRKRFSYQQAQADGSRIAEEFAKFARSHAEDIRAAWETGRADFLGDRDEEIWLPIFAICRVAFPSRLAELQRTAVDLCTLKTTEAKRYSELDKAEEEADEIEYGSNLLRDLLKVCTSDRSIFTSVAVDKLKGLSLSPWRTFRGPDGLTPTMLADMLSRFGVHPTTIRQGKKVQKGYKRDEVSRAVKNL